VATEPSIFQIFQSETLFIHLL